MNLERIETDFTDEEKEKVVEFQRKGLPGLAEFVKDEVKMANLFNLYMSGKTYVEISKISRVKKDIILYLSARMRWYESKIEYYQDIQKNITQKLVNTRVESMNFIANLISSHHKFYGDKINEYLSTGNREIIEELDTKNLNHYFKSIDILEKMLGTADGVKNPTPQVNINMTGGDAQVKQVDEKTIEINTDAGVGKVLKALAELKDEQKNNQNN